VARNRKIAIALVSYLVYSTYMSSRVHKPSTQQKEPRVPLKVVIPHSLDAAIEKAIAGTGATKRGWVEQAIADRLRKQPAA